MLTTTLASDPKANRVRFGEQGRPIPVTRLFVADMAFDHDGVTTGSNGQVNAKIDTKKWIGLTPDGQRVHFQTYDGNLGKNVDWSKLQYSIPGGSLDSKDMKKKLKDYTEVAIDLCPVAINANPAPVTPETPEVTEATEETVSGETVEVDANIDELGPDHNDDAA